MVTTTQEFRTLADMSPAEVESADFSTLVGLLNEPNMPSGGGKTVRRVVDLARLRPGAKVLEVGSNTGYTSIEFAAWVDGQVTGIDINPLSVLHARAKAEAAGVGNVRFDAGDGKALPYADGAFDLVFCSNVTSFIDDHAAARDEYYRVVAPGGWMVAAPIYYATEPPEGLRCEVGEAIGVELALTDQAYWMSLFGSERATLVEQETYEYVRQSDERLAGYAAEVVARGSHDASDAVVGAAQQRLHYFYDLFDRNLAYARYDILMYRCDHPNPESILHTTRPVVR
ncbi:class I SAM-dependent methyltransferase [Kitasatospora sp. NPDC093102]|uniref:class I SAM-dependent methyltransferase n=1 Tax=Kitasatospora sp. NPDC093102 TaxID=3155069 RepID=UPI0034173282